MIRIIKPGREITYEYTCGRCECIFEYEVEDVIIIEQAEAYSTVNKCFELVPKVGLVRCPSCNKLCKVKKF